MCVCVCVQYRGVFSTVVVYHEYHRGVQYRGGYHEYRRGVQYCGAILSTVRDNLEYRGGCSVPWGIHDACGEIS